MAKSEFVPQLQEQNVDGHLFQTADDTTAQEIFTAGAEGSRINSLVGTNVDAAQAHVATIYVEDAADEVAIGAVNIPANSGRDGSAAAINLLNRTDMPGLPLDGNGTPYILLKTGKKIKVALDVQVGSNDDIHILASGWDY